MNILIDEKKLQDILKAEDDFQKDVKNMARRLMMSMTKEELDTKYEGICYKKDKTKEKALEAKEADLVNDIDNLIDEVDRIYG